MIAKSRTGLVDAVTARVKELHSYTVPEVVALPIIAGSDDYLSWLKAETGE
jgi:periplasmic divalent cation tolerance protein